MACGAPTRRARRAADRCWARCGRRSAADRAGGVRFAQNAAMEDLLIVTTGGTIDKVYFDDKSDYQVGEPQIGHILEELGVAFRFHVIPILRKDSLHIDAADRELLRATIAAQPTRHVLVTHGTDTMVETAKVLASLPERTIVLTGALPPARFRGSDAEFNVGTAVGAVQSLPPGVYIAMNGRIWDPARVRKNVAANRFEAI
jgi:L-asparaginase